MSDTTREMAAGAAAGFAACGPMTVFLAALRGSAPPPPRVITARSAEAVGVLDEMGPGELDAATMAGHFGYGTTCGTIYGLLAPHLPGPPAVRGVGFGLALWAASYAGWLPAAGLYPPPHRQPRGRNPLMIAAHVVWGAVLGLVHDELAGDGRRRARPRNRAAAADPVGNRAS